MNKKVVFLPYDMDTALGINNEGELVFGYSLEDTDHVGNDRVYNGQNSVLWNNLRDCFGAELQTMYRQLRSSGALSYAKVEKAFEDHQAVWPAAIFNEDAYFKYLAPWFDDNDKSYLRMLLGSKAEQRKWWLYNRFRYIDSKYNAGDALTDFIMIRIYNNSPITITPYADVYINIAWGSLRSKRRATRNTAYTIPCEIPNPNDQEVAIYSASQLADLGDMSGLKVGYGDFSKAIRLSRLILGSDANGYSNTSLRFLNIGALKLLQKIDCRNCVALGTEGNNYAAQKNVDLKDCTGIEEVYFDGTSIASVTLPEGGSLKKLHLPGTVTNITIKNQPGVTEFVCPDFSNVTTVNLESSLTKAQVETIIQNVSLGCQIRLFNYRWDFESISALNLFLAEFDGMHGIDQSNEFQETPQLFFTAHVPTATGDQIDAIHQNYPDVTIDADVASYYVKYYNEDGTTLLYTETVNKNQNGTWATQPTKMQDAQYTYTFAGWGTIRNASTADANARNNITGNRNVYAVYTKSVRTYTVIFRNVNNIDLQTVYNVPYGGTATYTGATPVHPTDSATFLFNGWSPNGANIIGDTVCVAQYQDMNSPLVKYLKRTLTKWESNSATKVAEYGLAYMGTLEEVETTATMIENNAFYSCGALTKVDLTATNGSVIIKSNVFYGSYKLQELIIRSNSVATLENTNIINSPLFKDEGCIYVPAVLVNDYKAANNWITFAKNIYSIDNYPITDFSTISETWTQIKAAIDDESFFSSNYAVGDYKKVTYGQHTVYAEIRKIDTVNKYVDFIVKNPDEMIKMNVSGIVTYENSGAYYRLDHIYNDELQSDLASIITPITKKYYNYQGNTDEVTVPLWLLNSKDAGFIGGYQKESEGEAYFDSSHRPKANRQSGRAVNWQLGSAASANYYMIVMTDGTGSMYGSPGSDFGLVFGFRIKKTI